jgi:rhodanese-related sulfurtransferase
MSGLILLGITAVLSLCFMWIDRDPSPILPSEAIARIHNKSIHSIIDVRDKKDWTVNHYPDSLNLPLASIPRGLPNKIPDRSISILFYSEGGYKAAVAAKVAQELGYNNVYFLEGPYTNLMTPVKILTQ